METIILVVVLSLIGAVTYTINRKGHAEAVSVDETQPMEAVAVDSIEPYERVLLNAAKATWCLSSVLMDDGTQQWYVVDKHSGKRLFMVDTNTHAVKHVAQKPVQRKRTVARTN